MPNQSSLPGYEPMLAAYHRAYADELRAIVGCLPLEPGHQVLDMACGDGVYSGWLAERVGPSGRVTAVDRMADYLDLARRTVANSPFASVVEFSQAPIEALPFGDGAFDLCWCAQSLYSLPDPVESLRNLRRITKPGGVVAVLESDTIHHLLLPWPPELELAVRTAELRAFEEQMEQPRKFYVGRQHRAVFQEAGIEDLHVQSVAIDRTFPLSDDERIFFEETLKRLARSASTHLDFSTRKKLEALADSGSPHCLWKIPSFSATCLLQLVWGRVPC